MYRTKFVGLDIYNNLRALHVLISRTVFEIQRFGKNVKTPPPLILGKYYPDCAVQGRLSIPR